MSFYTIYTSLKDRFTPLLKESRFFEAGVLTPEEFVQAGDFLVSKCPTWSWCEGVKEKKRNYLPSDKQYLITKNVPCLKRAKDIECADNELERVVEEEWVETYYNMKKQNIDQVEEIDSDLNKLSVKDKEDKTKDIKEGETEGEEIEDLEDLEDLEEMGGGEGITNAFEIVEDPNELTEDNNILKTRTYNISITYDKGYQTPRIWLFGFDENGVPLNSEQIFEDISQDHAKKTVTIETHPHENFSLATIHPCRHASVMKKITDNLLINTKVRPDMAILIFLKFMSSVLPTINYDFTISLD